ncbi:Uncharacterised protein [Mycobacteroides abscessus subsp. abscessus]|nr:Uncharacterised protein [Mycobacteroides abscessus subsp. abscessus]
MSDFIPDRYSAADEMYGLAGWTPLGQFIDVQVGTDFTADCDCGWSLKTKVQISWSPTYRLIPMRRAISGQLPTKHRTGGDR